MLIVNELEENKKYVEKQQPDFSDPFEKMAFLRTRDIIDKTFSNVKSVSVQIKDIRYMHLSSEPLLIALRVKLGHKLSSMDDEEYITFNKKGNELLVYKLIKSDWILKEDDLNKTAEELLEEVSKLELMIHSFRENIEHDTGGWFRKVYQIELLEYKKECIMKLLADIGFKDGSLESEYTIGENNFAKTIHT